jgi:NDP-4-keto-2,6-dideoxyhexose 3-C-methyltransferase
MLYDLEDPLRFMRDIAEVLAEDGIWVFEQSYMPTMLERNSYDTVCHEHLEYYGLKQIVWMAQRAGLKIVDVEFNDVNGGSFSLTAAHGSSPRQATPAVAATLCREQELQLDSLAPYNAFAKRVAASRDALLRFIATAKAKGERVCALGASTKGNVLLQYCAIDRSQVEKVGEVNSDKFGSFTPGSLLPIVPEQELLSASPDYLLVLPWHFRPYFMRSAQLAGRRLLFPLPELEVVSP